jgi:hypothetical protein
MKKSVLLLFSLALAVATPASVMAFSKYIGDVNDSCSYEVIPSSDCISCHVDNDYKASTLAKDQYTQYGACSFCTENTSCVSKPPTEEELYADARKTTKEYFETLFSEFMKHMSLAMKKDPENPDNVFANVFPDCPKIAPVIASDISRNTGYLVRRVTERTRNSRNAPDDWELQQLQKFKQMAANGEPRTLLKITKPGENSDILPTMEYEAYEVVVEADVKSKGKNRSGEPKAYFRYMRSITMPGMPNEPPNLPCLKCHGTPEQLGPGVAEATLAEYPYDQAMGYAKGDIRGAWTVKIPLDAVP